MTLDGTVTSDPAQRPPLEPGLIRRARPAGFWWRTFRQRPWATGMVISPLVGALVVGALVFGALAALDIPQWIHVPLVTGVVALPSFDLCLFLRRWVRSHTDAVDEAEGTHPGRLPVDVRGSKPVRPAFEHGRATAKQVRFNTVATPLLVGGAGVATLTVAIIDAPTRPDPVAIGIGVVLVAAAPIIVAAVQAHFRRRMTIFLARSLDPTPVRVVGLTADGRHWVVEPVDGGRRSYLLLHNGDDRLVAGDIVHWWGDAVPDPAVGGTPRIAALTGPFGTLWASSVRDRSDPRVRLPADSRDRSPVHPRRTSLYRSGPTR